MDRTKPLIQNIKHSIVGPSDISGEGLFAAEPLSAGMTLGTLDGQRVKYTEHKEVFSGEWNSLDNAFVLYRPFATLYSYINHSGTPNLRIDSASMSIITKTEIPAGTELTLDYCEHGMPQEYLDKGKAHYLGE